MDKITITGTLYNKNSKVLAVGEWEALSCFLDTLKKLNLKTLKKRDFEVKVEYNQKAIEQAEIIMCMEFGGVLKMYSKEVGSGNETKI